MALHPGTHQSNARKPSRRRVKRLYLPVSRLCRLEISLRRFRTRQERRSKHKKQLVFAVDFLSFREVAIVLAQRKRPKKSVRRSARNTATYSWPHRQALAPAALIIAGLLSSGYFGLQLEKPVNLTLVSDNSASSAAESAPVKGPEQPKSMPRSTPTNLRIPKVGIDTTLIPVGLQASGQIAPPDSFDQGGWYEKGPAPGEVGPATIVGHVDSPNDIAVFWRLRELLPGDRIEISRTDGTTAVFNVTDIKQFPQDNFPTEEVYGSINYAGLRLITCGGTFDTQTGHYTHNTVVYAALE